MEKKKKEYKRWSKSSELNGITKSISVKEAENGFVIEISKYGRDVSSKSSDSWIDENKTFISTKNPLSEMNLKEIDEKAEYEEAIKALGL